MPFALVASVFTSVMTMGSSIPSGPDILIQDQLVSGLLTEAQNGKDLIREGRRRLGRRFRAQRGKSW